MPDPTDPGAATNAYSGTAVGMQCQIEPKALIQCQGLSTEALGGTLDDSAELSLAR